jgi:acetyl-CoA carboxylase carboxyl transferase subunit beta
MVYRSEFEANLLVCPQCGYHHRLGALQRLEFTVDPDSFEERHDNLETVDPLGFTVGKVSYLDKIAQAREKTGLDEALIAGRATIEDEPAIIGAMDFGFRGGSLGSVVGEKFCRMAEDAIRERLPLLVFCASGGARMEEGILSLMQMAKTSGAVGEMNHAGVPYLSVLCDPTSGGVFASFASLGDVIMAEPGAYIGFAGTRLIEGALKVKTPEGFQRAEYQYQNGFVDMIVKRTEMRPTLARLIRYLSPRSRASA